MIPTLIAILTVAVVLGGTGAGLALVFTAESGYARVRDGR